MNSVELKNILIRRITEIEDVSFLNAIKTILDSKAEKKIIQLTAKQQMEIIASKKEIDNGLYIEQSELDAEIERWLNEK
ncbi:MAG: hypothetical protein ACOC0C_07820 [Bacteroidota bacterium]